MSLCSVFYAQKLMFIETVEVCLHLESRETGDWHSALVRWLVKTGIKWSRSSLAS